MRRRWGRAVLWSAAWCVAVGARLTSPPAAVAQGGKEAAPQPVGVLDLQLRTCRAEADRRLPDYTSDQIQVEPASREGGTSYFAWLAGKKSGRCAVAANGRLLDFTTDPPGAGPAAVGATTITCESDRAGRKQCPIPQGARTRLVRQLSDSPCRLDDTYGQGLGYLWVEGGCRGRFEVFRPASGELPGNGGVTRITCEAAASTQTRNCPIPAGARARFVTQVSAQPCVIDQTYGVTRTHVWVNRGCRAVFEVSSKGFPGGGTTTARLVCESSGAAKRQCAVAGVTSVRLVRQYGTSRCRLTRTFGAGFGHIWVSDGCRGEFEVTVSEAGGGSGRAGPATR